MKTEKGIRAFDISDERNLEYTKKVKDNSEMLSNTKIV